MEEGAWGLIDRGGGLGYTVCRIVNCARKGREAMLGNFSFSLPTRLYFGDEALSNLPGELRKAGPRVLLVYGGGSIRKIGLYDTLMGLLKQEGKEVAELSGVMPNPTVDKLYEGCRMAREQGTDLILAVGGGSTIDCAKGISACAHCQEDPWEKFYLRGEPVTTPIIPVGAVLTMTGTGSEMNGCSVITHPEQKRKLGCLFGEAVAPKFAILNPKYTLSLPRKQMAAGCFDIMSHILEQYLSGTDDNTTDYIAEGMMRSLVHSSRAAVKDPMNYEARSNIMWTATWALNSLLAMGKETDWQAHSIGEAIGAYTDATHGMTLSAITLPYFRWLLPFGLARFRRFAVNVWQVPEGGRTDEEIAAAGLEAMEAWMRELGVAMNAGEVGVTQELVEGIADAAFLPGSGYRALTRDDVAAILRESLKGASVKG